MPNPVSFQWLPVTIFCKIIVYIIEVLKELKKKKKNQSSVWIIKNLLVSLCNEWNVSISSTPRLINQDSLLTWQDGGCAFSL